MPLVTLKDYEQSLLDRLSPTYQGGFNPDLDWVDYDELEYAAKVAGDAAVALVDARNDHADAPALAEMLLAFADLLGCSAPGERGLKLFLAAVDLPRCLIEPASIEVARTHKYMRMPLPADIMRAITPELHWLDGRIAYFSGKAAAARSAMERRNIRSRSLMQD